MTTTTRYEEVLTSWVREDPYGVISCESGNTVTRKYEVTPQFVEPPIEKHRTSITRFISPPATPIVMNVPSPSPPSSPELMEPRTYAPEKRKKKTTTYKSYEYSENRY